MPKPRLQHNKANQKMETKHTYQVAVRWESQRQGMLSSSVLPESIRVATPPEFTQGMAGIWSPEHLFVAAVNSCLMTTFLAIAENSKLDFTAFESNAEGTLEKVDGKLQMSAVTLYPTVTVANLIQEEKALRVLQKAEAACLISNSIKSTVHMQPSVLVATAQVV